MFYRAILDVCRLSWLVRNQRFIPESSLAKTGVMVFPLQIEGRTKTCNCTVSARSVSTPWSGCCIGYETGSVRRWFRAYCYSEVGGSSIKLSACRVTEPICQTQLVFRIDNPEPLDNRPLTGIWLDRPLPPLLGWRSVPGSCRGRSRHCMGSWLTDVP